MTNDVVKSWMSNARGAEYGFIKAVIYAHEQFEDKNNLPMYGLIALCNGKKFGSYKIEEGYKLTQFSGPLRNILAQTLSNVSFVFKDGKAKVKVGDNGGVNGNMVECLRVLAAQKIGPKAEAFKDVFPAPIKVDNRSTEEKCTARVKTDKKWAKDNGISKDAYLAMIAAQWDQV